MKPALKIVTIAGLAAVALAIAGTGWLMFSAPPIHRVALAGGLVDASSAAGRALLDQASATTDYRQLVPQFVPQRRRAYCGVATGVMVINALLQPTPRLTQSTLFTPAAAAVRGELAVSFSGLTLDQLARLIAAHGLAVATTHAADASLETFRQVVQRTLSEPRTFVVVNYDRRVLGQEGSGHIAPLAAFNAERDAALILDVAAHKYPHTWVPLPALWQALGTTDPTSAKTRGYLVVSAR